jgi:hypothetical protein
MRNRLISALSGVGEEHQAVASHLAGPRRAPHGPGCGATAVLRHHGWALRRHRAIRHLAPLAGHLLHSVVCVVHRAEHPVAVRVQLGPVRRASQTGIRCLPACLCSDQRRWTMTAWDLSPAMSAASTARSRLGAASRSAWPRARVSQSGCGELHTAARTTASRLANCHARSCISRPAPRRTDSGSRPEYPLVAGPAALADASVGF